MELLQRVASLFIGQTESGAGDEEQIELSRVPGTIWNAILLADQSLVQSLCERDPRVVEQRGAVGDLPIHMCFLYNSAAHLRVAQWIMERYPHQVTSQYLGEEYRGENIVHIAIINRDLPTVQRLIDRPEAHVLLQARATGRFFSPGSACYYGELPLSFAACTNQTAMVRALLDAGADIEACDSAGNNLLHLLVIHNLPDMYTFIKNEYRKRVKGESIDGRKRLAPLPTAPPAAGTAASGSSSGGASASKGSATSPDSPPAPKLDLWMRPNHAGLTPFCLAAATDARDMFAFLLQESKNTQWTFGPVSCDLYPLQELDLAISRDLGSSSSGSGSKGRKKKKSERPAAGALELIMNAGNVDLLMHPRLVELIRQKWEKFAERIFHQRFRAVLAYLTFFILTTVVRQTVHHVARAEEAVGVAAGAAALAAGASFEAASMASARALAESTGASYSAWSFFIYRCPIILWCMEGGVLAGALYKARAELSEARRSGIREYFSASGSALLENLLSTLYCFCIFLVAILSAFDHPAQSAVLAVAAIAGWGYLFFFLLAFRLTGPMVVMVHQMLTNDVARFCVIYLVFLMGFASAFFVLFESTGVAGFVASVQRCFVAMLGDFDMDAFAETPYTAVTVGLLVVYVVTITILLLNLLIAMMGDTFDKINEAAEMQWHLERARIVFAIENEMSSAERESPANKYWTEIGGQRFLQVLEVNPNHFKTQSDPVAAAAAAKAAAAAAAAAAAPSTSADASKD